MVKFQCPVQLALILYAFVCWQVDSSFQPHIQKLVPVLKFAAFWERWYSSQTALRLFTVCTTLFSRFSSSRKIAYLTSGVVSGYATVTRLQPRGPFNFFLHMGPGWLTTPLYFAQYASLLLGEKSIEKSGHRIHKTGGTRRPPTSSEIVKWGHMKGFVNGSEGTQLALVGQHNECSTSGLQWYI